MSGHGIRKGGDGRIDEIQRILKFFYLHQRIEEHRASAVGKHINEVHAATAPELTKMFSVLN